MDTGHLQAEPLCRKVVTGADQTRMPACIDDRQGFRAPGEMHPLRPAPGVAQLEVIIGHPVHEKQSGHQLRN